MGRPEVNASHLAVRHGMSPCQALASSALLRGYGQPDITRGWLRGYMDSTVVRPAGPSVAVVADSLSREHGEVVGADLQRQRCGRDLRGLDEVHRGHLGFGIWGDMAAVHPVAGKPVDGRGLLPFANVAKPRGF